MFLHRWARAIRTLAVSSLRNDAAPCGEMRLPRREEGRQSEGARAGRQSEKAAKAREKCKWSKIRGTIPAPPNKGPLTPSKLQF